MASSSRKQEVDLDEPEEDVEEYFRSEDYRQDTRLYYIRRTVLEMLRDRGYNVPSSEIAMTKDQFWDKCGSNIKRFTLDMAWEKRDNPQDKIAVYFIDGEKVGVNAIKRYAERMKTEGVKRAIWVLQHDLTPYGKLAVTEMSNLYRVEIFEEPELLLNVTEHIMVPKHSLVTEEELKALLDRFSIALHQLPRISVTDPIVRYYGLEKGQVVKVMRRDEEDPCLNTTGAETSASAFYRRVE